MTEMPDPNAPCPCGSGKTYRECCAQEIAATQTIADQTIGQLMQEALQHHRAGRLNEASDLYQQILQAIPEHPDALHLSGLIAHQQGNGPLAVALIDRAISANPLSARFYNSLGLAFHAQGDLEAAMASYARALTLQPGHPEASYNLGRAFHTQGDLDAAAEYFSKALASQPGHVGARSGLQQVRKQQDAAGRGRWQKAQSMAYATQPASPSRYGHGLTPLSHAPAGDQPSRNDAADNAAELTGSIDEAMQEAIDHHQAGRFAQAEIIYRQVLQADPHHPDALHLLGVLAHQAGKDEVAVELISHAINSNPYDPLFYGNYGAALRALNKLDMAAESYKQAIMLKPDFAEAYYNLGNVLLEQDRLDEAIENYSRAISYRPDYADAYGNLAHVLHTLGRIPEAIASCGQLLALQPENAEAWNNLAVMQQSQDMADAALASYNRALALKPDFAEAWYNLGFMLQESGQLDEAANAYNKALEFRPDYSAALGNLGWVHMQQGRRDEALVCFRKQAVLEPDSAIIQHQIAALTGNNPEKAPARYVEDIFDTYAEKFDTHMSQLEYGAPQKLAELAVRHAAPSPSSWKVLDLGCGTGLSGAFMAPYARQLTGVDLSRNMLDKAGERALYHRLEQGDLLDMMRGEPAGSYDAIVAADVFIYLGRLDEIVREAKRLLAPGGICIFSVEALDGNASTGYRLEPTGRYAHSTGYLEQLASQHGFFPQEVSKGPLRLEREAPVEGYFVLWKASA
jgi:predicted TPR repeat methyltransferase